MTPAEQAAMLRAQANQVGNMVKEAETEYTSKNRLRDLAVGALSTLQMQFEAAADAAQAEVERIAADSGLIIAPADALQQQ